jgi:hypothetical protein
MLDCGRGHSGIKFDNHNPQDWLAGESQWARGHLKKVGSARPLPIPPRDGRPDMIPPRMGAPGGAAISYTSFLHGAALFFLLAIASWCRTAKS